MDSRNEKVTKIEVEAIKTVENSNHLLGGEWSNLHIDEKVQNPALTKVRKLIKLLTNVMKIFLGLIIILLSVMVSIGHLEGEKANNTIKLLSDLRSVLSATLEWRNATTLN